MWKYITKPLSTLSKKQKQKQKQKKYFSNKNKKCQEGRQIILAALVSFGKLLKRQSQHGEPNRAGKDYWHPKWCVIMGYPFHISAVNTSGPQTAKKAPVGLTMALDIALLQGSTVPLGANKLVKAIKNMYQVVLNLIPGADVKKKKKSPIKIFKKTL